MKRKLCGVLCLILLAGVLYTVNQKYRADMPFDASAQTSATDAAAGDGTAEHTPGAGTVSLSPASVISFCLASDKEASAALTGVWYDDDDLSVNAYNGMPFAQGTAEYFADALFIGNSRMRGFVLYAEIPDLNSVTYIGWLVGEFFTSPCIYMYGERMTGAEAVALCDFEKVYLNFGFNDLMFDDADAFARDYRLIVNYISEYRPDAVIFINSILPVHPAALAEYPYALQERVDVYNEALRDMAIEEGCVFLDSQSVFLDEEGYMDLTLSWEGVHVHESGMRTLREYWLSHTVNRPL